MNASNDSNSLLIVTRSSVRLSSLTNGDYSLDEAVFLQTTIERAPWDPGELRGLHAVPVARRERLEDALALALAELFFVLVRSRAVIGLRGRSTLRIGQGEVAPTELATFTHQP